MLKEKFEEFLKQKEKEKSDSPEIDWEQQKKEWLLFLSQLYKIFEDALKEYRDSVKTSYSEIPINEEYIGTYKAKVMAIKIFNEEIKLKPIGTNLIGAKGRVDMSGRLGSAKLVLVDARKKSIRDHIKVSIKKLADEIDSKEEPEKKNRKPIEWEWRFISSPPARLYQPVNEETILSAIMELVNVS